MIETAKHLDSAGAASGQAHASDPGGGPARFPVLGVGVSAVQIPQAIEILERWILERRRPHYVAVTGMHGITEALYDQQFRSILRSADLVVPDGMPLVWIGRWRGFRLKRRVYGPELMATFFQQTGDRYRHFFYGGAPGVAERLSQVARQRYGIRVVGTYCPPFRKLTDEEDREAMQVIADSRADILWVGLSTPKQERWMSEHLNKVSVPVMLGVGAAFDLNAGTLRQAPNWMRENGLEWLFRLTAEPRRLWHRYLVLGSKFAWNVSLELLGLKAFE
ncbi:MAG TPA: WecB/TagA/CpsF family glycosyltransferase [Terriglobales bacterium]|jgi:N-acetylglucosaminyldiphosphoundecaprenol N-acetyl-beta-D-mannosaminyltransferase|nr:WecB/TagA/CpsF family glycosyltransferase [Terriglobales bacterium]